MNKRFTNERVEKAPAVFGVEKLYVAIERKTGQILSQRTEFQINHRLGPHGANSQGADWVWAEMTPDLANDILEGEATDESVELRKEVEVLNEVLARKRELLSNIKNLLSQE